MKATDKKELQTKNTNDLQKMVDMANKTLAQLKLDHAQSKLKNTRSIYLQRKEIAIMKSVLSMQLKTKEEGK